MLWRAGENPVRPKNFSRGAIRAFHFRRSESDDNIDTLADLEVPTRGVFTVWRAPSVEMSFLDWDIDSIFQP